MTYVAETIMDLLSALFSSIYFYRYFSSYNSPQ